MLSSLADETPEGRSIVDARQGALRPPRPRARRTPSSSPFTAQTRMSGVDFDGRAIRKGAADSVRRWVEEQGGTVPAELDDDRRRHRRRTGGTPLVVAESGRASSA